MQDKPRYSRISDILDLAIFMSSKIQGVTITEIAERYNVSRRTAERMRDSLTCIFPQVDEIETDDIQKHWGFTNYSISQLISFTSKEVANIELCQRQATSEDMKEELAKIVEKIKSLNKKNLVSLETGIELILQTEGYAVRQLPQYKISLETLNVVRECIQSSKVLKGIYHKKERILEPLGLVYGEKIYLIARERAKGKEIYNYILHKFEEMEVLDDKFERGDFKLSEYSNLSFGVYHGDILDVELLFAPNIAEDASKYNFHPTQSGKFNEDGSYSLNFKASGDKEIMWHIFKWGSGCKIISPKILQDEYKQYLKENLENYL